MIEWKDETSYSRNTPPDQRVPSVFAVEFDGCLRVVLHHFVGCGDIWFVSCNRLRIKQKELEARDLDKAKLEALQVVHRVANWEVKKISDAKMEIFDEIEEMENAA